MFPMHPGFSTELMPKGQENESQEQSMTVMDSVTNEELDSTYAEIMRIAQETHRNDFSEVEEKRRAEILSRLKGIKFPKRREMGREESALLSRYMSLELMEQCLPPYMLKQIFEGGAKYDEANGSGKGKMGGGDK